MKVKFVPQNVEFEIKPGQTVLHCAQDNNVHIKSVCRGIPSCAECRVRVIDGEHNVLPPNATEVGLIGSAWFVDRRRLSCQLRCFGDITIDMSEQIEKTEGSGKKPRGRYNKDELQESRAVLGSLVMSDDEKSDALEDDEGTETQTPTRSSATGSGSSTATSPKTSPATSGTRTDGLEDASEDEDLDDDGEDLDGEDADDADNADNASGPALASGSSRRPAGEGGGKPSGAKRRRRRGRRGKRRGGGGNGGGQGGPGNSGGGLRT